ncbi:hypothetical protein [Lyngbya sp. CCY1209]|uniref:hypothetical protein n=1 Tax=Lyngbya sp. CCY1209 TaxID=2886103 RepID=UPI002D2175CD|nr:hypothetical protein [Lyngbya sp. CCY1209]MEB3883707.1 hypothetical protein [Lyngbya sp. CCY1209]
MSTIVGSDATPATVGCGPFPTTHLPRPASGRRVGIVGFHLESGLSTVEVVGRTALGIGGCRAGANRTRSSRQTGSGLGRHRRLGWRGVRAPVWVRKDGFPTEPPDCHARGREFAIAMVLTPPAT